LAVLYILTPQNTVDRYTHPSYISHRELLEERYRALEARGAATRQAAATTAAASPRTTMVSKLLSPGQQQPRVAPSGAGGASSPVRAAATATKY
jgi:hypothetical protein